MSKIKFKPKFEKKLKIRSHDKVLVICGKYKGAVGEVQKMDRAKDRVFVSGVNIVTRHSKKEQPKNKIASIHISNVSHYVNIEGKNVPSKVHMVIEDGIKKRVLTKTGAIIEEHDYSKNKRLDQIKEEIKEKKSKATKTTDSKKIKTVEETKEKNISKTKKKVVEEEAREEQ